MRQAKFWQRERAICGNFALVTWKMHSFQPIRSAWLLFFCVCIITLDIQLYEIIIFARIRKF